jgi:formylglycine-generating enzyme required for sulfatase activity
VTVGQFRAFVTAKKYLTRTEREGGGVSNDNGAQRPDLNWRNPGWPQTEDCPVVQLTYEDAAAFCEWLSGVEGRSYRVPNEAQWEWAARGGTSAWHYWVRGKEPDADYAWVGDTSGNRTHPVGQLKPNVWGLYDTHGNAVEWCSDYYSNWPARDHAEDDVAEVLVDPHGPIFGTTRTLRGTAYYADVWNGVTSRGNSGGPYSSFGFRVLLDVSK